MQTIRTFAQLKSHIKQIKHEGNLRTPEEHLAYQSWLNGLHRFLFVAWVRLGLVFRPALLTKNQYPYTILLKFLPKVDHKIVWYRGGRPQIKVINSELVIIQNKSIYYTGLSCSQVCYFENLKHSRSIPSIHHLQVFVSN